jgi:hypothetical protein
VGVFKTKQSGLNHVLVQGSDGSKDIRQTEYPLLSCDGLGNKSTELGKSTLFVVIDVAIAIAEEFIARFAMHPQSDLVGHRAAGHENRRILAQEFGDAPLKLIERRVDVDHIVADLCAVHCLAHRRGRSRNGITSQIDHSRVSSCGVSYCAVPLKPVPVPNQSQLLPYLAIHRKPLIMPKNHPVFVQKDCENIMKKPAAARVNLQF